MAEMSEKGYTGLVQFSGIVQEDFLREWRGKEAYKRANEMRLNSPIIASLLTAVELSIRKVAWPFESDEGENDPRLELLEAARDAMSTSWNDHVIEALTFLPFGFSIFEIVYKLDDRGRVVWRKFAPRGQDTIFKWLFDESGGLAGFVQVAAPVYKEIPLPIESLILYRTRVERGNPEGRSILRSAWVPYFYAKHIQQIEGIGIERDLAGMPYIKLPEGATTDENDTNSDVSKAAKVVRNMRNDEQAGLVLPFGWEGGLITSGGTRLFDTDKVIRRYESRMLMSALAQFLLLGQEGVGSLALSRDQTDFFTMSVNAIADILSETFTKYAIPRLLALNGYDSEGVRMAHTPAGEIDMVAVTDLLQRAGAFLTWTPEDEVWLRKVGGLPEVDVDAIEAERQRKQEIAAQIAGAIQGKRDEDEDDKGESKPPFGKAPMEDKMGGILERYFSRRMAGLRKAVGMGGGEQAMAPIVINNHPAVLDLPDDFKVVQQVQPTPITVETPQPVVHVFQAPAERQPDIVVNVPRQEPPVVNITVPKQEPPVVTVEIPKPKKQRQRIIRDKNQNIDRTETDIEY